MIYIEYNSTTRVDPRVFRAARIWNTAQFGNTSSRDHRWGWDASEAVEDCRNVLASFIAGRSTAMFFSGSATESLNAAIKGFVGLQNWDRKKIITCATEHEAVLAPCRQLRGAAGIEVEILACRPPQKYRLGPAKVRGGLQQEGSSGFDGSQQ